MEINIVIKTGNLYEEINKNINYILSKINKKINIIFVSYDSKCNQNLVYESYGEYDHKNTAPSLSILSQQAKYKAIFISVVKSINLVACIL